VNGRVESVEVGRVVVSGPGAAGLDAGRLQALVTAEVARAVSGTGPAPAAGPEGRVAAAVGRGVRTAAGGSGR
jgi:hypothetical protein